MFQRVLLEVATHWIFNLLVTLAALAVLATLLLRRYQTVTLKTFAVLVVVRLFLATVILANSAVDYVFLDSQVKEGEKKIDAIKSEVSAVSAIARGQGAAVDERITQIGGELGRHQQERTELAHDLRAAEAKIMELESQKPKHPWWKPEVLTRDPRLKALNAKIDEEHVEIARIKSRQRDLDKADSLLNEERACLEKRTRGETCSWFEKIRTTGDWFKMPSLDIEDKIDSLITLMALIMLRSILLPLFFWVVIYKTIRWIWTKQTDLRSKAPPSRTEANHTANSGRAEPSPRM